MPATSERERLSRLLIVEDDPSQLRTLTSIMEQEGFDVIGASTAAEALEHVKRNDFGVAVVDLRLPDLKGTRLLEEIQALSGKIRVIIHTAYGSFDSAKQAVNLGAFAYIEKTHGPEELIRHVHAAFRWHLDRYAKELEEAVAVRTINLRKANKELKQEITERKRAEEQVHRQNAVVEGINKVLRETLTCATDEEVARKCLAVAEELTGSQFGFVGEVNQECLFDNIAVTNPGWEACTMPKSEAVKLLKNMELRGLFGRVVKDGQSLMVNDPPSHPDRVGTPQGHPPVTCFLGVPLKHGGKTIGMIGLANKESGYDFDDQEAVEALSGAFVEALLRKRADEALRESEEKYRRLFATESDAITLFDAETRRFLDVNDAALRLYGYTREEFLALSHSDITAEPAASDVSIKKAVAGELSRIPLRYYKKKDGTVFPVEISASTFRLHGRTVVCGAIRDITERKRAEEEKAKLEDQLRQSQKMEAVGRLAGGVAHDFNNLLTVISSHTDLVKGKVANDSDIMPSLKAMQQAVEQATGVTRALLTFTHKLPTRKNPINLHEVVLETTRMLERTLPAVIELVVDGVCEPAPWVNADKTQLQQVLLNLAVNARDAMPDGGTLRISVSPPAPDRDVGQVIDLPLPPARKGSRQVIDLPYATRLVVRDTGIGMSRDVQSRIFEPFFTGKSRSQGTGLGLAIIHGVVKDHGGRIEVRSEVGKGSTFTIYLPCVEPQRLMRTADEKVAAAEGRSGLIVLAEDQQQVREIVAGTLVSLGYTVVQAADGEALLELAEQHRGRIQLFVINVYLPKRTGLDGLRAMRAKGLKAPAIVITGNVDAQVDAQVDPDTIVLGKPFQMSELGRLARQIARSDSARNGQRELSDIHPPR